MKILKFVTLTICVPAGGVLVLAFYLTGIPSNYINRTAFDQNEWQSWEESEGNMSLRWDMSYDLTNNYELIGLQKSQVIELLGVPDGEHKDDIYYDLGVARSGIDYGTLILKTRGDSVYMVKVRAG